MENIGLVVVDNLSTTEESELNLEESGRIHLEEAGCDLLREADCSSPAEEHVLVASSSCGLRLFVVAAVGR